jgi:2-C-methyl-D-erythritol 4-phosphate cytidylyltransferase/2-C-methyl-D-erythritol 2,4-cyclodiphosphate synthase
MTAQTKKLDLAENASTTSQPASSMRDLPSLAAVIVAAGTGNRMTSPTPKQFLNLLNKPVLCHSLDAFLSHPNLSTVVIVGAADRLDDVATILGDDRCADPRIQIVAGGRTRQESVNAGLSALIDSQHDLVAIHDAARPLLNHAVIDRLISAITPKIKAALPVLPVADTLKSCDGVLIGQTIDRDGVMSAQTPQIFDYNTIINLHEKNKNAPHFTDDVSMAEAEGLAVAAVPGDEKLMKLTHDSDFITLTVLAGGAPEVGGAVEMRVPDIRIGNGFDVHKFSDKPGPIMLAGISLESARGMLAHSDGDVGLHALCDAIFGALGDGDIGSHFPPSDVKWKDADSTQFLAYALDLCASRNAQLLNLDLTIICEHPKITPHRDAMRARIAEITNLSLDRIGVKATTSEGLGFTGRGEGIAAQATASLYFGPLK